MFFQQSTCYFCWVLLLYSHSQDFPGVFSNFSSSSKIIWGQIPDSAFRYIPLVGYPLIVEEFAMENGHLYILYIVDLPINMVIFHVFFNKLRVYQRVTGWWFEHVWTILKNMSSSMGRMTSHILWKIWWKIFQMFETTKQVNWVNPFEPLKIPLSHLMKY